MQYDIIKYNTTLLFHADAIYYTTRYTIKKDKKRKQLYYILQNIVETQIVHYSQIQYRADRWIDR